MNKTLVLYHASCADGFGAAWAAWKKLGDTADYKPVQYGQEPPDVGQYVVIYILDFSYPLHTLMGMSGFTRIVQNDASVTRLNHHIMVIDHHLSAQQQLKDYPHAIFDMTHSGAYLAWKYFHPDECAPELIRYVEDRDMWWWKLPHSREISAALWSYPMEFDIWDTINNRLTRYTETKHAFVMEGAAILRYMQTQIDLICNQAYWTDRFAHLGHPRVACVNATNLWSEIGEELLKLYPESPFTAYYHILKDCKLKWGLRSKGEFDVSEIAKTFGGGGHKNAAGFVE